MNRKRKVLVIILGFIIWGVFSFRNHLRLFILNDIVVHHSEVTYIKNIDETYFNLDLYACNRSYKNSWARVYNSMFSDQIAVFQIPLNNYMFNNIVMSPIGKDEISDDANIYFNTVIFNDNFIAKKGIINDQHLVNKKTPHNKRIGIDKNGRLKIFTQGRNSAFEDVIQSPISLNISSPTLINMRDVN